ncbi:MAG: ABC transporter ATP-binding protein [Clostridium sp.]|uniref:ABC transporter ATP-binding protein n=1 Tax=Clostridium sp. TaxID=1506 RepID=UPI0030712289
MMNDKKKESISFCNIIIKITPMAFATCPIYFIVSNLIGLLHGISHGFRTLMTQRFFDSVTLLANSSGILKNTLLIAMALGLALILNQILNGIDNFMLTSKENMIIRELGKKINDKAGKLDLIVFENTEYLDDIKRAKEGIKNSAELLSILTSIVTLYLPYFIFIGGYLYKLNPILAVSLVIIFIPTVLTQVVRVKVFTDLADAVAPIRREYEYYERCIVDREYYKETRILGLFGYFKNLYTGSLKLLNKEAWKAAKKVELLELGMKLITLLGYMGVLYLLFKSLLNGDISVGAFAAVFSSIEFMFSVMEEIICVRMGKVTSSLGSIKNFIRFLDIPERNGKDVIIEGVPNICLDNVSFNYQGTNKASLSNVNLEVKAGETIAIVGENGAGKTTLVKIMMGIYIATEGRTLIGGQDTSEISPESINESISAVFQKYQRYQMTLGENIEISSLKSGHDKNYKHKSIAIQEAALKSDLEVREDQFKYGYETMLSREFDGIDLSGGQWKKIAIARGFYRNHNMIVLDEPTAAIDPANETKVYKKFANMAHGKTAIIVTHRLGSAKIADRIVVMDNGKIDEIGSHDELIIRNGKYANMYEAQSKWYYR